MVPVLRQPRRDETWEDERLSCSPLCSVASHGLPAGTDPSSAFHPGAFEDGGAPEAATGQSSHDHTYSV